MSYHAQLFGSFQIDLWNFVSFFNDKHVGRAEIRLMHLEQLPSVFVKYFFINLSIPIHYRMLKCGRLKLAYLVGMKYGTSTRLHQTLVTSEESIQALIILELFKSKFAIIFKKFISF